MNSRRDFFRQFVGQMGILLDEFNGVECIPLSRLKELPDKVVRQIEPVFFPEEKWDTRENILYIHSRESIKSKTLKLNRIEIRALEYFKKNMTIEKTSNEISKTTKIPFDDIYKIVTSLFFNLASLHICHPRKAYHIDKIIKSEKYNGN